MGTIEVYIVLLAVTAGTMAKFKYECSNNAYYHYLNCKFLFVG